MAITLEDVERLREKANVSYEEAKAALERSGGDLLDALIDLERQGKTKTPGGGGTYSTRAGASAAREPPCGDGRQPSPPPPSGGGQRRSLWDRLRELLHTLFHAVDPSTHNRFEVWRQGRMVTSMPLLILIIAVIAVSWITVPLLILGLLLGWRYQFSGPDLGRKDLNDAMDHMSRTVDDMKAQVRRSARGK